MVESERKQQCFHNIKKRKISLHVFLCFLKSQNFQKIFDFKWNLSKRKIYETRLFHESSTRLLIFLYGPRDFEKSKQADSNEKIFQYEMGIKNQAFQSSLTL